MTPFRPTPRISRQTSRHRRVNTQMDLPLPDSFSIFDNHRAIGLDFDGTLIDNPRSIFLQQMVVQQWRKKQFYIITFRTHGMERTIFRDIGQYPDAPLAKMFAGVVSIPYEMWERWAEMESLRRLADLPEETLTPDEVAYVEWKGKTCHEHGCTILVDDHPEHVLPGCVKYGVEFVSVFSL